MSELPDELMRELLQSFQVEAVEHLQTLNQALLKLERSEDEKRNRELIQGAFRAAHSLKGAARAVNMEDIESLAHALETVLQQARTSNTSPEVAVCDVLYKMLDAVQALLDGQKVDIQALQERLASVADGALTTNNNDVSELVIEESEVITDPTRQNGFKAVSGETIRVAISKLDTLMAQSGELVISKISAKQRQSELQSIREELAQWPRAWREIETALDRLNGKGGQLRELLSIHHSRLQTVSAALDTLEQSVRSDTIRLGMTVDDLQTDVRRLRMLPLQTITLALERAVRDAARVEGKQVLFSVEGADVELDKKVLETLKDPLLHLLRNAVSHGIETKTAREAAGKPSVGQISLKARQRGSEVSLSVSDDGRGFDLDALRHAANSAGASGTDDSISLAFLAGITTAPQLTAISGRGIGLDVVRQHMEDIHGRIVVDTRPGNGATIELIVPMSLAITRALLVSVGTEQFALPLSSIERIVEISETFSLSGKEMVRVNDTPLSLISLASILERDVPARANKSTLLTVIISIAEQRLAIQVDDIITELELAVKPIGEPFKRVRNVAGVALMGNGLPVVVLNPADLIRSARDVTTPNIQLSKHSLDTVEPVSNILVVDDSITTRTLEKNILEAAGYRVITAINGIEALKRLDESPVDLVVADVEMPQMDGIVLTQAIRDHDNHKRLPIILVTSLESQEDREKGMIAGADAYIVKRGFNQGNLLTLIKHFLQELD